MKYFISAFILYSSLVNANPIDIPSNGMATSFSESSACAMAEFSAQGPAQAQCQSQQGTVTNFSCTRAGYPSGRDMYTCHVDCVTTCQKN